MQKFDLDCVHVGDHIRAEIVPQWNGKYVLAEEAEDQLENYIDLCSEYEQRIQDLKEQIDELEGLLKDAQNEE